ncbi:MAG: flavin reductase family protein [SAR324 cluster bacterium]|nr:flavin reductase family protein [SAR324 cluster bacterium]
MFFETKNGMKPPPFKRSVYTALVLPRPIGWISTLSKGGIINLAPFSFFNAVSGDPPCVIYCPNGWKTGLKEAKDSLVNVEETGEFVFSICTFELREQMNKTSAHVPSSVDEMALAGLEAADCKLVAPPRVKASPIALECKYLQTVKLPESRDKSPNNIVLGQVIGVHISDEVIVDGMIDVRKVNPLSRLGYLDYATLGDVFSINRPD